jgi:hypothetical protein
VTRSRRALVAVALAAVACGGPGASTPISQPEWDHARQSLVQVRSRTPKSSYVERIRVAFKEPRTGKIFAGRGAIAVDPHNALRMILLGPAGTTALDVWATRDHWRFAIPPANVLKKGGEESPPELPIGFFRSWFLRPYEGRLLTIDRGDLVLEDHQAVLRVSGVLSPGKAPLRVMRREGTAVEWLEVIDRGAHPPVGERVRYRSMSTGLEVEVLVESLSPDPADPAAFLDPDGAGLSL